MLIPVNNSDLKVVQVQFSFSTDQSYSNILSNHYSFTIQWNPNRQASWQSTEADSTNLLAKLDEDRDSSLQARSEVDLRGEQKTKKVHKQLSMQHQRELKDTITHLEGSHEEKDRERDNLQVQLQECSIVENQLKAVSEQPHQEQESKKVYIRTENTLCPST